MANFTDVPVLSKIKIGSQTYYLKDAEVRALIPGLEAGIADNAAAILLKQDIVGFADGYNKDTNKAATVATVTNAVAGITSFEFEIVEELPTTGKKGTIYLKKHTESGVDMYEEFIWVNNRYEKIGDTRIDLSNYYTKTEIDGKVTNLETAISDEEDRATAAEEAIADDLADEVARATAAEQTNAGAISAEVTRATGAEGALSGRLDTAEDKLEDIEDGAQVNKIEHIKLNGSDVTIDANKRVDLGSLATEESVEAIENRVITLEGEVDDIQDVITNDLGDFAYANTGTATVASKTVSGVKATGNSTGSLSGSLGYDSTALASSGDYTPAGTVSISGSALGSVTLTAPAGTVKSMKTAGSVASFTEGDFTPATLTHTEANFAKAGIVAHVGVAASSEDTECLYFEDANTESASLISAFNGGSKAADTFTANVLPTFEDKNIISSASISTTDAELSAGFTGTEATVSVSGNYDKANLGTVAFAPAAISLNVGDVVVPSQTVTVNPVAKA